VHITYVAGPQGEELLDAGSNPPDGVALTYSLRDHPDTAVDLAVFDADGAQVTTLSGLSNSGASTALSAPS
jgi:hypothetical protein